MPHRLRHTTTVIAVALAVTGVACAHAQPPPGITRPADERGMSALALGASLFAANCSTCHGIDGRGVSPRTSRPGIGDVKGLGPSLRDAGALAADFYLRTGYMPLARPDVQPERTRVLFSDKEVRALVAYVASLGNGPAIPNPHPETGSIGQGLRLFTTHCAGCHQIVGRGGVVTGARVPTLLHATPVQIAEAVRTGPYLMPRFSARHISDAELNSIVRYVLSLRDPPDRGGWAIGNIGPFPEGMVTWLLAAVVLIALCMVLGARLRS